AHWAGFVPAKKPYDPTTLTIDGKPVPEAQNPDEVIFSPNGKRYMAICHTNMNRVKYVVVDGRKGPEYQTIAQYRFAPDSSRAIYLGSNADKNFVVVDGQPSPGFSILVGQTIAVSQKGGHYAYIFSDGSPNQTLIVDGQPVALNGKSVIAES